MTHWFHPACAAFKRPEPFLDTLETANALADGEVAQGVKGFDPIANRQLTAEEIRRCEKSPAARLQLWKNPAAEGEMKRKGPRYTPLSKRQDRPAAIAWLVKFHPELSDGQIAKLVGTTKPTIEAIRSRGHHGARAPPCQAAAERRNRHAPLAYGTHHPTSVSPPSFPDGAARARDAGNASALRTPN